MNHLKDLPIFSDKIIHLNIGGQLKLEWQKVENWIYKRFVELTKSNIETCLRFVSPIVAVVTELFNLVFVPNLMKHTTNLTHEINVRRNLFCDEYTELEEYCREWFNFYVQKKFPVYSIQFLFPLAGVVEAEKMSSQLKIVKEIKHSDVSKFFKCIKD